MGTVRSVVLPVLRLLVWSVIAVCLVWIAFVRDGRGAASDPARPSATVTAPEATVVRADVVNLVTLEGTIVEDPPTTVRSTAAGTVGRLRVGVGDRVSTGAPLFTVLVPVEEPVALAPPDPAAPPSAPRPRTRTVTVTAPTDGTVTTLDVLPQQVVEVGAAVATLSPGTLTASAPLTQAAQFRLLAPPSTATVTVPGGPGAFECPDLRTGRPQGAPAPQEPYADPFAAPGSAATGATLTCRVPPGTPVFAGASAVLEVTAGEARGVLVAPVTAVQGTVGTGSVWVLDGDPVDPLTAEDPHVAAGTEVPVELGLTDGENVEIRSGVAEGTRILQFAPTADDLAAGPGAGPWGAEPGTVVG